MKVFWSLIVCSIFAASVWGQEAPAPASQPTPPQAAQPGQAQAPPMPSQGPDANAWRAQRTQKLRAELDQMRAKLAEMKVNAAKVKEPAVSKQLQLEEELWAMMLSHVEELSGAVLRMATGQTGPQNRFSEGGTRSFPRRNYPQLTQPINPPKAPVPDSSPAPAPAPAPNQ